MVNINTTFKSRIWCCKAITSPVESSLTTAYKDMKHNVYLLTRPLIKTIQTDHRMALTLFWINFALWANLRVFNVSEAQLQKQKESIGLVWQLVKSR